MMKLLEKKLVVGPFQCNCRILVCPVTGEAAVVDPGDQAGDILAALSSLQTQLGKPIQLKKLLHTHGHLDHIGAAREVKEAFIGPGQASPQIALHRGDEQIYQSLKLQGRMFGIEFEDPAPVEHFLEHEEDLQVGKFKMTVVHTPGHSPGSVCLRLHESSELGIAEKLFSGDTLFQGSVGRTDLWGADQDQMFHSIRSRILTLDEDTVVCPGHGPDSKVGVEKRSNPFLV